MGTLFAFVLVAESLGGIRSSLKDAEGLSFLGNYRFTYLALSRDSGVGPECSTVSGFIDSWWLK